MALRPLHAAVALGAGALGVLTERAAFIPPFSILTWVAAGLAPIGWQNQAAIGLAALVAVLFAGWCLPLLRGRERLPAGAYALPCALGALSAGYFVVAWSYGVRYQGLATVRLLLAVNVVTALALLAIAHRNRRRPAVPSSFAYRWVLLAWFVTAAFPWLGESV